MQRKITVKLHVKDADVSFVYQDSGPGLSQDIVDPNRIFEPHFTTKKDSHTGEDTGTGLGMWLVKSFVEDNKGTVELLSSEPGFGLRIYFPNKLRVKIA
jgi:signal transduction histidine kinase